MKKKLLSLKEIHQFLIKNNLMHKNFNYKKQTPLQESKKENSAHSCEKPQISDGRGEIY